MSSEMIPKRVLVVAYLFPPVGGAGVQRIAKFVKYLPQYGWEASVLTVANPSVPLFDESLNDDIPEGAIIRYARTFEPGYTLKQAVSASQKETAARPNVVKRALKGAARGAANLVLQPDSQILWWPNAVKEGMRLLNEIHHDAIFVTAPPFSSFVVGKTLSQRTGLPLILDYRDEWDISTAYWENKQKGPFSRWIQSRMQNGVIRAANAMIATTLSSSIALSRVAMQAGSNAKVSHIYNGYDAEDFSTPTPSFDSSDHRFRLAYVGTLWNLTSIEPLVASIERLSATSPELASQLELVIAGRQTGPQNEFLSRLDKLPCHVSRMGYLDHQQAIDLMRTSDSLCVLLSDVPEAGRVVPAKIFEYMAAGRRILSITPEGEGSQILADYPFADVCAPNDVEGIVSVLATAIKQHSDGTSVLNNESDASRFERRNLTGKLAELLNDVTGLPAAETNHTELELQTV